MLQDKWIKIKKEILNRQKREAESLQAIQKLNWQWKLKDENLTNLLAEDAYVPLAKVNEEFDFS